jgi:hypothetical protein
MNILTICRLTHKITGKGNPIHLLEGSCPEEATSYQIHVEHDKSLEAVRVQPKRGALKSQKTKGDCREANKTKL